MLTLKQINKQIQECLDFNTRPRDDKERKKAEKKILFLNQIKKYLESNPTKEFIEKEIGRLENRVNKLLEMIVIDEKMSKAESAKYRKTKELEFDIPKLRSQLKTLYFILN